MTGPPPASCMLTRSACQTADSCRSVDGLYSGSESELEGPTSFEREPDPPLKQEEVVEERDEDEENMHKMVLAAKNPAKRARLNDAKADATKAGSTRSHSSSVLDEQMNEFAPSDASTAFINEYQFASFDPLTSMSLPFGSPSSYSYPISKFSPSPTPDAKLCASAQQLQPLTARVPLYEADRVDVRAGACGCQCLRRRGTTSGHRRRRVRSGGPRPTQASRRRSSSGPRRP